MIVFEGLHGCGKSTQINMLEEWFSKNQFEVFITSWNSYMGLNEFNSKLKTENKLTGLSSSLIHALDFELRYSNDILPNMQKGIVLFDRYIYTAYVRDSLRGIDYSLLEKIYGRYPIPKLIIYLDIDPEESIKRIKNIKERSNYILGMDIGYSDNPIENFKVFLENQRKLYRKFLPTQNTLFIDGTLDIEEIHKIIIEKVKDIYIGYE